MQEPVTELTLEAPGGGAGVGGVSGRQSGADYAAQPALVPEITGRGWITGTHQHLLDPSDPWPVGYRLSDT